MPNTIDPNQKNEQKIDTLLHDLGEMLEKPNADQERLIEQAYRIIMLVMRYSHNVNRQFWLDRTKEWEKRVEQIQKTYNSPKVLTMTVATGVLTILGAAGGAVGAIPALGAYKNVIGIVSKGAGTGGQLMGPATKIAENSDLGLRTKRQAMLEMSREKSRDRKDASDNQKGKADQALRQSREINQAKLNAIRDIAAR